MMGFGTWVLSTAGSFVAGALLGWLFGHYYRRPLPLDEELRRAIERDALQVYYQPIVDLRDGRCVGAEALLRWAHPERGMIPPGLFVTIAEESQLIRPLTQWLMRRIASDLSQTYRAFPQLTVAINLQANLFCDEWLLHGAREAFENQIPFHQLTFEIVGRGIRREEEASIQRVMRALRERGAKLSVDDFGVGYSSLAYLQRFEVDTLKIDKAFVDGISSQTESSGLVDPIIAIAQRHGLEIVAEGVERKVQAVYLCEKGVKYAQGWHFAEPMSASKYVDFVAEKALPPTMEESDRFVTRAAPAR
jgi:sensor c-di-GMP phosphodiesterase-like protein